MSDKKIPMPLGDLKEKIKKLTEPYALMSDNPYHKLEVEIQDEVDKLHEIIDGLINASRESNAFLEKFPQVEDDDYDYTKDTTCIEEPKA